MHVYKTLENRLKETLIAKGDAVCPDPPTDKQVLSLRFSIERRVKSTSHLAC
jgi:hypothetical protein